MSVKRFSLNTLAPLFIRRGERSCCRIATRLIFADVTPSVVRRWRRSGVWLLRPLFGATPLEGIGIRALGAAFITSAAWSRRWLEARTIKRASAMA
jgi:hypothetical protein